MPKRSWREFDDPSETSRSVLQKSIPAKTDRHVLVQRTKAGRRGKTVTIISGLQVESLAAQSLLKRLKAICGTGGTVKGDSLELQGDQVRSALDFLYKEGFRPKQSGN